ncbi:MAG: DPP IV N-terminal domain-containing protein [Anaerolineae bacterium]|nr:DPP IV N-terminal domain-containing protein [Anaerolineae bacterium]
MLRKLLPILAILLVLAACSSDPTPAAEVSETAPAAPTATATVPATATATAVPTETASPAPSATPAPSPTPTPLPGLGLVAFETERDGNAEIYLLDEASGNLLNLTRHPSDDRSPAWRPDGGAIAFESRRDGNWEIYVLELSSGAVSRLTNHPGYDGAPAWSPTGVEIAFESYRDGNLEIYVQSLETGTLRRLTEDPAGDYGPAWSPDGDTIAFTSWRDGNREVYAIDAAGGEARNLTQHPADDEAPVWGPEGKGLAFVSWRDVDELGGQRNAEVYWLDVEDGSTQRLTDNPWPDLDPAWDAGQRLVWAAYEPGPEFETYDPRRPGDFHLFRAEPGEAAPLDELQRLTETDWDDRRPAPAPTTGVPLQGLAERLPPLPPAASPEPTLAPGELAEIVSVPGVLASYSKEPVRVNELVAPSLAAWRQAVLEASGWDFLHGTLGAWRNIDSVRKRAMYTYDYGFLSWHKTGRALDLALEYKVDGIDQMVISREDLGSTIYWRIYLRTARQDGSQGEPLKENPWRFWWHIVPSEEPEAYDAGGKRLPIPAGYFVDVTALAIRHGWERIAAYAIDGDYHWNVDSNGTEYWHYERTGGLVWWEAMQQLYSPQTLEANVGWEIGLQRAQSEAMMRSKGVPTPAP